MRVAVYSGGSPDYLIDIVTDGLIRILGRSSVHVRYSRATLPLPQDHIVQDFGGVNCFAFSEADLLIASTRTDPNVIVGWRRQTGKDAIAIIDGEDDSFLSRAFLFICKVYFKRERLIGKEYPSQVRSLPFGMIPEEVPAEEGRTTDVAFRMALRSQMRVGIRNTLNSTGYNLVDMPMTRSEYNRLLSRSLIGISARSSGWDTYRYWETPYFGCALLAERPRIEIPDNFRDGEEAVFFETLAGFQVNLDRLLKDPARTRAIAMAGQEACNERHLSTHRAKTVLDAIS
jgi:hypothetical protein